MCGDENAAGSLLCCDGCPRAFHLRCLQIDPSCLEPDAIWLCPDCETHECSACGTQQPAIRQATIPDTQAVVFEVSLNHQTTTEHAYRQYSPKLAVDFPEDIRGAEAFGCHPVEDFSNRHGADGGR